MELNHLQQNWDDLGRRDPLWAILADPAKHGNRWQPDDFYATGEQEVAGYFSLLDSLGLSPGPGRALDFGCGAGRLTQALGGRFAEVTGIDIADSMVELATRENARRSPELARRVTFLASARADLSQFPDQTFDLVLSIVVLQHMNNALKASYLKEFCRVLRPGGVAIFTVPSHADWSLNGIIRRLPNPVQNVYRRWRYGYPAVMEFHAMRRDRVEKLLDAAGCRVEHVEEEPMAGPPWTSYLYVVRKP